MTRYFLKVDYPRDDFNAEGKAPADVNRILSGAGYEALTLTVSTNELFGGLLSRPACRRVARSLGAGDTLFVQYPFYIPCARYLSRRLLACGAHLQVLVHDLDALRGGREESVELMKAADCLVVHTKAMKDFLAAQGFDAARIRVLHFFDYLISHERQAPLAFSTRIAFAGNLCKSAFLKRLRTEAALSTLQFDLFGAECPEGVTGANVTYRGRFKPDDLSTLTGDWGLVWDGEDTATCRGGHGLGLYLQYNASHKLSLYLAARMPLIVWAKSGLSDYVTRHHLGIAVNALSEIPARIATITPEERQRMEAALDTYSRKVKRGEMLLTALGIN